MSWYDAPRSVRNALFPFALVAIAGAEGSSGPTNTLLFSAEPDHKSHRLFSTLATLP